MRLTFAALVTVLCLLGAAKPDAIADMQRGDYAGAEKLLRAALRTVPTDGEAMSLLGVALDYQQKLAEAGELHKKAVARLPRSVAALNNYANHLLFAGDGKKAEATFLQIVAIEPSNSAANRQLAHMAVEQKKGAEALALLKRLPAGEQGTPDVELTRLEALYLTGQNVDAGVLLQKLNSLAQGDLNLTVALGHSLTNARQFDLAEALFSSALSKNPTQFDLLYSLGVVAVDAGHAERAIQVLDAALRQQPDNVYVMYSLAFAENALGQNEAAVTLLAKAAKLAPARADIQKLLARITYSLRALDDSMAAWNRYLKLAPDDDGAHRERAHIALLVQEYPKSVADLKFYVAKHPADAEAHVELGVSQSKINGESGLVELNKALQLKPDLAMGYAARGALYYTLGRPKDALPDLEFAAGHRPDDAASFDRLGQTYQALDRPADAVRVLRQAARLSPNDSQIQLHLGVALNATGQTEESKVVMERFRELGPARENPVPAGLVDYLSLTPEQKRADYRSRVEKAASAPATDGAAQVRYMKLLLEEGKATEAGVVARTILGLKPAPAVLIEGGQALVQYEQFAAANDLLEQLPAAARPGAYYLARAVTLGEESSLTEAVRRAPDNASLYRPIVNFLGRNNRYPEAVKALDNAPPDRELLLLRTIILLLASQADEGITASAAVKDKWPEWQAAWVAYGTALAAASQFSEARPVLETALRLGAHSSELRAFLNNLTRPLAVRDFAVFLARNASEAW